MTELGQPCYYYYWPTGARWPLEPLIPSTKQTPTQKAKPKRGDDALSQQQKNIHNQTVEEVEHTTSQQGCGETHTSSIEGRNAEETLVEEQPTTEVQS